MYNLMCYNVDIYPMTGMALRLNPRPERLLALTTRETEVLRLVAHGHTALQIGSLLGITKRTVSAHTQHATFKLGAANSTHAVAILVASGQINMEN